MLEFVISIVVAVVVAFAWMAIWTVALRAFGIQVLARTPEERALSKQRIVQMGKLRYTLAFGVLGYGFALGLGIAVGDVITHEPADWGRAAAILGAVSLLGGSFHGVRAWNIHYRPPVPFPPHYPPLK